ncbi:MAG: iron-sulfur cluster assembly scaffold protein, partial [Nanoarchaeota archaeon]|nr:iron-sulfur cluster assembly scaffold protein [Nanoarchaeota archaeon]
MSVTYSRKTMEHFLNPKNMGEIRDADGVGKVGNPQCGDVMWIYIKVGEKKIGNKIEEIIK